MDVIPISGDAASHGQVAAIWNAACGRGLQIPAELVRRNMLASTGVAQAGAFAVEGGQAVGFVQASCMPDSTPIRSAPGAPVAWIDALAVDPAHQRRGIGRRLLAWTDGWLGGLGAPRAMLGAGIRPFAPGLPAELDSLPALLRLGFCVIERECFDVAMDLGDLPAAPARAGWAARPATGADAGVLRAFMQREFAGRWTYELDEHVREGQPMEEFILLEGEGGVQAFCHITFEHSQRPIARWCMHELPRPWGQLGPIGVSAALRGAGLGRAMLDAGLARLRESGVRGCVIDWTNLVALYARWGFRPYRRYVMMDRAVML